MAMAKLQSGFDSLSPPVDLPEFVVVVADKYKCVKCLSILRNAMQTLCGHRMCEHCVYDLVSDDGKPAMCPAKEVDCEMVTRRNVNRDMSARRELLNLLVHCSYKIYGCRVNVRWRELKDHVYVCEFRPVPCKNKGLGCNIVCAKQDIKQHEREVCLYRTQICECGMHVPKASFEEHKGTVCTKASISCPYGCDARLFIRENLTEHLLTCTAKPVKCLFNIYGCSFESCREDVEQHDRDNNSMHLTLLMKRQRENDKHIKELEGKIIEIDNRFNVLRDTSQVQHNALLDVMEKADESKITIQNLQRMVVQQTETITKLEGQLGKYPVMEQLDKQTAEILQLKEAIDSSEQSISRIEREGAGATNIDALKRQVTEHDTKLSISEIHFSDIDTRFQVLETTNYNGNLIWKIGDYRKRKQEAVEGRTISLYSQPFYTSRYGYKMCARIYLNGDGLGKGSHMSLFFVVMQGNYDALLKWPFRQKVSLILIDQEDGLYHITDSFYPDPNSSSFRRPINLSNVASGCPMFVAQSMLEGPPFVKDDTMFIKVVVDTFGLEDP